MSLRIVQCLFGRGCQTQRVTHVLAAPKRCMFSTSIISWAQQENSTGRFWQSKLPTYAEVAKRFERFDKDGDGLITTAELHAAMDRMESEISDGIVCESSAWDANADGVVDYYEFLHYFMDTSRPGRADSADASTFNSLNTLVVHCTTDHATAATDTSIERQQKVTLIQMFREIDSDNDGFISAEELRAILLKKLPANTSVLIEDLIVRIFQESDAINDGLIDVYEFSSRYRQSSTR